MKLTDLLFPPKCILCNRLLVRGEQEICQDCAKEQPEYPYGKSRHNPHKRLRYLSDFTAVWYYEGVVRKSILRYKFSRMKHLAGSYGVHMAEQLKRQGMADFDFVTWVPISNLRKLERGYNQSELLAKVISREMDRKPICCLKKLRHTRHQSDIRNPAMRAANVSGVFGVIDKEQIRGKRILLVDDILTTGATMEECARVLLMAGVREVSGICIAAARKEKTKKKQKKKFL